MHPTTSHACRQPAGGDETGTRSRVPEVLSAPVSRRTWRAFGYLVFGLPISTVAFSYAVAMFSLGVSTLITVLGIPVLAVLLSSARGFGAFERARAAAFLDVHVPGPVSVSPAGPGLWQRGTAKLRDGANWRGVLYMVGHFPWAVFSFCVAVPFCCAGWVMLTYPAWQWVFPAYTNLDGLQFFGPLFGRDNVVDTAAEIWFTAAVGLLLVAVFPWVVRGLAAIETALVRSLLGHGHDLPR